MLIDTHCHLNFHAYDDDYTQIIETCLSKHIWMIIVSAQKNSVQKALDMASQYNEGVYASVGLHPIHLQKVTVTEDGQTFQTHEEGFDYDLYKRLAVHEKAVAIGECGLDYFEKNLPNEQADKAIALQKEVLHQHINLANEVEKPMIFHTRSSKEDPQGAYKDLLEILDAHPVKKRGVVHCFSGNLEMARAFISRGYLVSFTGLITFAPDWDEVIKQLDINQMMVETDSPYLTPVPFRGKRNSPEYVYYVAEHIAKLKGMSVDEVSRMTTQTARSLFQI